MHGYGFIKIQARCYYQTGISLCPTSKDDHKLHVRPSLASTVLSTWGNFTRTTDPHFLLWLGWPLYSPFQCAFLERRTALLIFFF